MHWTAFDQLLAFKRPQKVITIFVISTFPNFCGAVVGFKSSALTQVGLLFWYLVLRAIFFCHFISIFKSFPHLNKCRKNRRRRPQEKKIRRSPIERGIAPRLTVRGKEKRAIISSSLRTDMGETKHKAHTSTYTSYSFTLSEQKACA